MLDLKPDVDCEVMVTTVEDPTDRVCDILTVDDVGGEAGVDVCLPVALVADVTVTTVIVEEVSTLENVLGDGVTVAVDATGVLEVWFDDEVLSIAVDLGVKLAPFEEVTGQVVEDILIVMDVDGMEDVVLVSMLPVDTVVLKPSVDSGVKASGVDVEIVLAMLELLSDVELSEDILLNDKVVAASVTLPVEDAVGECTVVDREDTKPDVDDDAITVVADGKVELATTEGKIGSGVVPLTEDTEVDETGN